MDLNPVLFPPVSNRETWLQIITLADNDTGQLLALLDGGGRPLYNIALEITSPSPRATGGLSSFYDDDCSPNPAISASLADYISILSLGTIQIQIPKSVFSTLHAPRTYDVYLTLDQVGADDGRQLLIGRLPVLYGGRNT